MNKKQIIILALSGAALVAATQAQAQLSYSDEDLMLDFRDITASSVPNLTVDEGNINTFLGSVSSGSTEELLSAATLSSALTGAGEGDSIGFSAGAGTASAITGAEADTLWLTRVISAPSATGSGLTASAKQLASTQGNTDTILGNIGGGMVAGTQVGTMDAATVSSGNAESYTSQTVLSGSMSYAGYQSTTTGSGGPLEGVQPTSPTGDVYEALWEVQPSTKNGSGGPADTYEGYFTYQPDGEVDFTAEGASAVPEPSTYGLITGLGVLLVSVRRQLRSVLP